MNIAEGFAAEFQVEAAATRKFLERFEDNTPTGSLTRNP